MTNLPKYSIEMHVISGLMWGGLKTFLRYGIGVSEDYFLDKRCKRIFSTMKKFAEKQKEFDPVIVSAEFMGDGIISGKFLDELITLETGDWEVKGHLKGLMDAVFKNRFRNIVLKEMKDEPVDEVISTIQENINRYYHSRFSDWSLPKALRDTLEFVEMKMKGDIEFDFGLNTLNESLCGLFRKEMTIIAGRTSQGKSALAAFISNHLINKNKRVLYIDLETGEGPMLERFLSLRSGVTGFNIHRGRISEYELRLVAEEAARLERLPLVINDNAGITIGDIYDNAISVKADIVVVDYLQLLAGEDTVEALNRVTLGLHNMAKALNIPVIAISQLNRGVDHRENHVPTISDIRGCGGIEEKADNILMMYWPYKYDPEKPRNITKLVIGKQRHGPVGLRSLYWEPETFKFGDMTPEQEEYYGEDE